MPSTSSCFVSGFTCFVWKCFISLHTRSIGLMSALLAGVGHQLILFSLIILCHTTCMFRVLFQHESVFLPLKGLCQERSKTSSKILTYIQRSIHGLNKSANVGSSHLRDNLPMHELVVHVWQLAGRPFLFHLSLTGCVALIALMILHSISCCQSHLLCQDTC